MKFLLLLLVSLSFLPFTANAGDMFGPAPFRNGSPLVTGVDGAYQATARAENVTGIFRFAYSGGSQTANARQNSWVFFVGGQVLRGNVEAAINSTALNGILDSETSGITRDSNGAVTLPIYIFSGANSAAGSFQGKLNLKSASGAFSGSGELLPTPPSTNQITAIAREIIVIGTGSNAVAGLGPIESTNILYTNSGGSMVPVKFKFRGVRTSTSSTTTTTNTTAF